MQNSEKKTIYMALSTTEIKSFVGRIKHRLSHRVHKMTPTEHSFLLDVHYKLKEQRKTALSQKQLSWLFDVLDKTA